MTHAQKIAKARRMRRRGATYAEIAALFGVALSTARRWVNKKRTPSLATRKRASGETCVHCGKPRLAGATYCSPACAMRERIYEPKMPAGVDDGQARRVVVLWHEGKKMDEIARDLGWSVNRTASVVAQLRKVGYDIPRRQAMYAISTTVPPDEKKQALRAYRKSTRRKAPGPATPPEAKFTEKQKVLLRLLRVVGRPVRIREFSQFLAVLPRVPFVGWDFAGLYYAFRRLHRRGFVDFVVIETANAGSGRTSLWFVTSAVEGRDRALTLDDAQKELELAVLIEEQDTDAARGQWAEIDWKTVSLDAPAGDGGSWHEYHEDEAA